jgi:hypothetical protein
MHLLPEAVVKISEQKFPAIRQETENPVPGFETIRVQPLNIASKDDRNILRD